MTTREKAHLDRVWEVIGKSGICMLTTHFPGGLRARPMEAKPDRDDDAIWFLTDRRGPKDDDVERCPEVCLTFVYPDEKVYLSLTGEASVCRDEGKARALWTKKQGGVVGWARTAEHRNRGHYSLQHAVLTLERSTLCAIISPHRVE